MPGMEELGEQSDKLKPNSVILHSRDDDVIPFADSEELVASSGLSPETLIEVGNDHRLADEESLSVMLWACNLLVSGEKLPWLDDESQSPTEFLQQQKSHFAGRSQLHLRCVW